MKLTWFAQGILGSCLSLALINPASASVSPDQVLSTHIKEADGTSGQDTNSGSGVKTGHLQNNAVTGAKIADGAVTNAKVGANAVTSDKISDGAVGAADLASGAVTNDKIGAGAVTDPKITGPISAGKIQQGSSSGLDADMVDGMHASAFQRKYANVVVVSPDGNGDFTSPVAAVASITNAGASNPYLVKIMPGVYDIGTTSLQMKEYVDVEGSGETVTTIVGSSSTPATNPSTGLVIGASNAELRLLTVKNVAQGPYEAAIAIFNSGCSPRLSHLTVVAEAAWDYWSHPTCMWNSSAAPLIESVTLKASGGRYARGITNLNSAPAITNISIHVGPCSDNGSGIKNYGSSPTMSNSTIVAQGYGIEAGDASSLTLSDVRVSASTALAVGDPIGTTTVTIQHSSLEGSDCIYGSGFTAKIATTQLSGAVTSTGLVCVGAYDGNFNPLGSTCQPQP